MSEPDLPSLRTSAGHGFRGDLAPVVLMGVAMETPAILKRVRVLETARGPVYSYWRARLDNHDILVAACGVGKVNAAMATQAIIERHSPGAIILFGSAGGLREDLLPGDIVIGEKAVHHDAGVNLGRRFVPMGVQICAGRRYKSRRMFHAAIELVESARVVAAEMTPDGRGRPPQTHIGVIATGDQVMFSAERKSWIQRTWDALAVEMEGAAVAQVAQANAIPWLIIRGISDSADDGNGLDLSQISEYVEDGESIMGWARRQGRRLSYLARHPEAVGKFTHLLKGIGLAAERSAALALAMTVRLKGMSATEVISPGSPPAF